MFFPACKEIVHLVILFILSNFTAAPEVFGMHHNSALVKEGRDLRQVRRFYFSQITLSGINLINIVTLVPIATKIEN